VYTLEGSLGGLLEAKANQSVLGRGRFMVFEMEHLMGMGERAVVSVLLFLFHQIEKRLDGSPTAIVLDEAWVFLKHELFKEFIRDWAKTLRKANAALMLSTQNWSDIFNSSLKDVLIETCPNKLFLPNPVATSETVRVYYEMLGVNAREIEMIYVLAFNDLLKQDKGRRKDIAGIGFLYWLRNQSDLDALDLMDRADPEQVKKLLSFDPRSEPDANRFYMIAVSGNGGRLRVHHWSDLALTQVKENLRNWHEQLRVEFPWDEPAPVRLWQLLYALDREGKPDEHTVLALLRRGIEGLPLGYSVLSRALTRLRHPGGGDAKEKAGGKKSDPMSLARLRVPTGLIRMCINDLFRRQEGAIKMSEGLDQNCTIPAYVCGRLMAEFENLQRSSSESEVNSSILDRHFALASTYPAVAFPKIENLAQKHLRKLRRDKPSAAYAIDGRLQELHSLLQPSSSGAYPGKLGLDGQGLFALGYYHQKARSRSQAQERNQANAAANEFADQEKN